MAPNETRIDIEEQAALAALDALGQTEARAVRAAIDSGENGDLAAAAETFASVIGLLGYASNSVAPPSSLRARLLDRIQTESRGGQDGSTSDGPDEFIVVRENEQGWTELGDGASFKELFVDRARGTTTTLLRILPGGRFPAHRHSAVEEIYVIEGDCQINTDLLGPGDYRRARAGTADRLLTSQHGTTVLVLGQISPELL